MDFGGGSLPAPADQDFRDKDRDADHEGTPKINHDKGTAAVFARDVRESPDIA